jgi:hypothetical protein
VPSGLRTFETSHTRRKVVDLSVPNTSLYRMKPRKWMNFFPVSIASTSGCSNVDLGNISWTYACDSPKLKTALFQDFELAVIASGAACQFEGAAWREASAPIWRA